MKKKVKNIEQLYSESFEDFRLEPSSGLWKKISSKLAWKNFISFNPTTFNAYYLTGFLAVSIAGALWITKPVSYNKQEIKEVSINKTIETPVITTVQENETKPKEITINKERQKAEGSGQKAVGSWQLEEGISKKQEVNNQKTDSCINDRSPSTQYPVPSTQYPVPSTREPVTPNLQLVTRNSELVTPEPVTPDLQLVTRNTKPVTPDLQPVTPKPSNQSLEPWLNIDSLFTNQTPTPPQHSIQFPNAFTPNTNGPTNGYYTPGIPNNDVFHPEYKGVVEYHLRIFNRRGELIFESNDINMGWDGYINARLAAQDVYVWKARGRFSNGENFMKFGNVMLIKK